MDKAKVRLVKPTAVEAALFHSAQDALDVPFVLPGGYVDQAELLAYRAYTSTSKGDPR